MVSRIDGAFFFQLSSDGWRQDIEQQSLCQLLLLANLDILLFDLSARLARFSAITLKMVADGCEFIFLL